MADINSTPNDVSTNTPDPTPAARTYTEKEHASLVAKAVTEAVNKAKQKASQTAEEQIAELQEQIRTRDLRDYARSATLKASIPADLEALFYGRDEEDIDARVKTFSSWYEGAIDKAVEDKLGSAQPLKFGASTPSATPKRHTLEEIARNLK